jgi:hydroxyacid-oxoacid transhydrogenase
MVCCHHYQLIAGCDEAFRIDAQSMVFGPGCLSEAGAHAKSLGMTRVALLTDKGITASDHVAKVKASLEDAKITVAIYDDVAVEPTDESFKAGAKFAQDGKFDGFVSVGGGSVMDTCKAANLYASYPADFLTYVNAPVGDGQPVPGPLKPHIACPTTSGTGSEATGIAIFDLLSMKAKTGIASQHLRPSLGLVDPLVTHTLPKNVIAATAFDVLSHALESLTSRPFTSRTKPDNPAARPYSQGGNPWSDMIAKEALRLVGEHMVPAVTDTDNLEAREYLMWASSLAGVAFGQAGCHLPHGMSYAVSGLVRDFRPEGYPQHQPIVPHGMSVILNAPSVFRMTGPHAPERHLAAYACLGGTHDAGPSEAGDAVAEQLIMMMKATGIPNGLTGVGYGMDDLDALADGALPQKRVIDMAPFKVEREHLRAMFEGALTYW